MSESFFGSFLGMGVADQQHSTHMADLNAREIADSNRQAAVSTSENAHEAAMDLIQADMDATMRARSTNDLIQAEAKETRKWIGGTNDNVNDVHRHIDDQTKDLMKFVGDKEEEQTNLIREVLTVVHDQADEIKALRADVEMLKREHA